MKSKNQLTPISVPLKAMINGPPFKPLLFALGLWCLLFFNGCSSIKIWTAKSLMADVEKAILGSADPQIIADSLPTLLLLMETLVLDHPTDKDLLIQATKAYTSYGTLVQYDDPIKAKKQFNRARLLGLSVFDDNQQVRNLFDAPYSQFTTITNHLKPSDGPLIFWLISSWGAWIYTNTSSLYALADLPKVIFLMEWVIEWDETYEYGAPHLFLGAYYAALPPMLGGNPEKSLYHFNRSATISKGQSLLVPAMKAQYFARQTFNKALHDSLLHHVINTPSDSERAPLRLQNELARQLAKNLLAESDAFFY